MKIQVSGRESETEEEREREREGDEETDGHSPASALGSFTYT